MKFDGSKTLTTILSTCRFRRERTTISCYLHTRRVTIIRPTYALMECFCVTTRCVCLMGISFSWCNHGNLLRIRTHAHSRFSLLIRIHEVDLKIFIFGVAFVSVHPSHTHTRINAYVHSFVSNSILSIHVYSGYRSIRKRFIVSRVSCRTVVPNKRRQNGSGTFSFKCIF